MAEKAYGDVAGTSSLASFFVLHALDHEDVTNAKAQDNTFILYMADGTEVVGHLVSNYKEKEE